MWKFYRLPLPIPDTPPNFTRAIQLFPRYYGVNDATRDRLMRSLEITADDVREYLIESRYSGEDVEYILHHMEELNIRVIDHNSIRRAVNTRVTGEINNMLYRRSMNNGGDQS